MKEMLVPVTPALVHFIRMLRAAHAFAFEEELLATSLQETPPPDATTRCRGLLENTYRRQRELLGLSADVDTLNAILNYNIPHDLDDFPQDTWEEHFSFHPQMGGIDYTSDLKLRMADNSNH
jgi:hypothetical protein